MGCDIHLYTEVKVKGQWYCYGHPNTPRCYPLFALMADVRNSDGQYHPVSKPKGLPADMSVVTEAAAADYTDGHSHSWLSAHELVLLEDAWNKVRPKEWSASDLEHYYFGYLEGNGWAGFARYHDHRRAQWIEDVRFVFWFDN